MNHHEIEEENCITFLSKNDQQQPTEIFRLSHKATLGDLYKLRKLINELIEQRANIH